MTADAWASLLANVTDVYGAESSRNDPVAFARDVLGIELWSKQADIVRSVSENRRTVVRSGHGTGKSLAAAVLVCWWVTSHPPGDALAVFTAPTDRQVRAVLWEEIRRLHARAGLPGTVGLAPEWRIDGQLVALGRKPADGDEVAFQGLHARNVLAVLDEAAGLPRALFEAVEGVTTSEGSRTLAIGNPDQRGTSFERAFEPGSGWATHHVSVFHTPAFTGEDVSDGLLAVLPSRQWAADARANWGESSATYRTRVLGDFPASNADALITWDMVTEARARTAEPSWPVVLGVDVARFGADSTVVVLRAGDFVRVVDVLRGKATTETAGYVLNLWRRTAATVCVDDTGLGGGVVDMLRENGCPVVPVIAAASASDPGHFANVRAEGYWRVRRALEAGTLALPDDDELTGQLARLRYRLDSRGRVLIESKADMRARGLPSPDKADALALTFAGPEPITPAAADGYHEHEPLSYDIG